MPEGRGVIPDLLPSTLPREEFSFVFVLKIRSNSLILLASPIGFEPTAPGLGILCSILLSYGDTDTTIPDSTRRAKPNPRPQSPSGVSNGKPT